MIALTPALLSLALTAAPEWKKVDETDGVVTESRPVEGSGFVELRLTTTTTRTVDSLCDAAYGDGKFDPEEPDLKSRKILSEGPDERVTYDQISPPLVANRDYAVRATRKHFPDGSCVTDFKAANELAPEVPKGWVRVAKVAGEWRFEPIATGKDAGKTRVTYVVFSDPGGSVPPFLAEGSRRKFALRWIKMILSRGKDATPDAGTP
ncbi:MAG: START domain-containing protein [Myxococcaceae bacterium]